MDIVKVRINPTGNIMECVKLIRDFDGSIPMGEIKRRLEHGDIVLEFDLDSCDLNKVLAGEITEYDYEMCFYRLLEQLESMSCAVELTHYDEPTSMQLLNNWIHTREEIRQECDEVPD